MIIGIIKKFFSKNNHKLVDHKFVSYQEADKLMKEDTSWILDVEREDKNRWLGMVYICKKITL